MTRVSRPYFRVVASALLTIAFVGVVAACGPDLVFRAYLGKTFWRPAQRYVSEFVEGLPREKAGYLPYAGMVQNGGGSPLQAARDAYRALFPDQPDPFTPSLHWPDPVLAHVADLVTAARASSPADADELDLLQCKVELRAAKPDDDPALVSVHGCFETYLTRKRPDALVSEARGWMARTDFLRGRQASAAKFYLDELKSETSNIRRERLLNSLLAIEPAWNDLDEYFDTPTHALFIANRITDEDDANNPLAAGLIAELGRHTELFRQGSDSDALTIALMRASTRQGAPEATLRYASGIQTTAARNSAEYNWLLGAARFEQKDYAGAASAFMSVMKANDADSERLALAANGLIGAYSWLDRPIDQLWAAFELASLSTRATWAESFESQDASYLLDVQLTDAQIQEYLARYSSAPAVAFEKSSAGTRSSLDAIYYEVAVRHARREEYADAARLYDQLQSPRAARMKEAEALLAATKAPGASSDTRLGAEYDYASFLADHENGIFFDDMLWHGFQTAAFIYRNPDTRQSDWAAAATNAALADDERTRFAQSERRLRDEQEEYWRAYQILNGVVQEAGQTPLGRKAAERAIICLRRISTERFGRAEEIRAADIRLSAWLAHQ